ncbi:Sulfocyanin (SoxE) domain-containing protein [Pricia antarctica]|uniref:Sulfocyanin (SoxE) domain-containing protein n=1 Tax=Pricia antarctica TaxID=641691 RepID=A0A1G7AJ90_9FLAO|nr:sulfocyanin-like copper-binding protein [Pricia antarctica]SDE14909.1 Sulfocyanin (SoxE) domain-containing protein [Pricia antarctica]
MSVTDTIFSGILPVTKKVLTLVMDFDLAVPSVDKVADMALHMGLDGADYNYVPETDLVIAHTGILEPRSSQKLYFEVPTDAGIYWIVCTFPGHAASMRIKLIVTGSS